MELVIQLKILYQNRYYRKTLFFWKIPTSPGNHFPFGFEEKCLLLLFTLEMRGNKWGLRVYRVSQVTAITRAVPIPSHYAEGTYAVLCGGGVPLLSPNSSQLLDKALPVVSVVPTIHFHSVPCHFCFQKRNLETQESVISGRLRGASYPIPPLQYSSTFLWLFIDFFIIFFLRVMYLSFAFFPFSAGISFFSLKKSFINYSVLCERDAFIVLWQLFVSVCSFCGSFKSCFMLNGCFANGALTIT